MNLTLKALIEQIIRESDFVAKRHNNISTYGDIKHLMHDIIMQLIPGFIERINTEVPGDDVRLASVPKIIFKMGYADIPLSRQFTIGNRRTDRHTLDIQLTFETSTAANDPSTHLKDPKKIIETIKDEISDYVYELEIDKFKINETAGHWFDATRDAMASRPLNSGDSEKYLCIMILSIEMLNFMPETIEKLEDSLTSIKDEYYPTDANDVHSSYVLRDYLQEQGHKPPNIKSKLWINQIISSCERTGLERALALKAWKELVADPAEIFRALIHKSPPATPIYSIMTSWINAGLNLLINPSREVKIYVNGVIDYIKNDNEHSFASVEDMIGNLTNSDQKRLNKFLKMMTTFVDIKKTNHITSEREVLDIKDVTSTFKSEALQIIKQEVPDPSKL